VSLFSREAPAGPAARPYGLFGLIVSTGIILVTAAAILILLAVLAFGVLAAASGWQGALRRFVDLSQATNNQDFADHLNTIGGGIGYVVIALSVVIVARFRGGRNWADLVGWKPWDMAQGLRLILVLLAATLAYSLVASAAIERVYPDAKDWIPVPKGTPWIIGFLALATFFAPITEELLFRGWIYTSLREVVRVPFAIAISAGVFALAHWESTHLYALAVFPVGLVLGYIRQRVDSVAASITFHALYNGVSAILLFVTR
jgi:uncharacterized protein